MENNKNIFDLSNEQIEQIKKVIEYYFSTLETDDTKGLLSYKYYNNDDYKEKYFGAFLDVSLLTSSLIMALVKYFNAELIKETLISKSINDSYEIQEFKLFLINNMAEDKYKPTELNQSQNRKFKTELMDFKLKYVKLLE